MRHCQRVPIAFDLSGVIFDERSLRFKSRADRHQKYGAALKRRRDYDHAPAVLHCLDEVGSNKFRAHLPPELLAIETPEIILLTVTPEKASLDTLFPPHIDKIRVCCVNVYLEPHDERTVFYDYAIGEMRETESFVAKDGECWVMDTTVPHAVELKYPHQRRMISASFVQTPFDTVFSIMSRYSNEHELRQIVN